MSNEIEKLAELIKDKELKKKVLKIIKEPTITIDAPALSFSESPGGAYQHHSYKGGLLQHTVSVTRIAITLCDLVEEVYNGEVDRDTVIASALLHDIYKIYTYEEKKNGGYTTSSLGEKIDHLNLLVAELYKQGFSEDIIHIAASHHGDSSPIQPKTLEALIVSQADLCDAEFNRKTLRAAEYLLRQIGNNYPRITSSKEALTIIKTKKQEGWKGLEKFAARKE
ncbi:HD domain-containing protein [Candidatus Bathyarchaeota archaeon]|nr:HD domain-containing protein [Candidatus Bathyarchaeota archaeon]